MQVIHFYLLICFSVKLCLGVLTGTATTSISSPNALNTQQRALGTLNKGNTFSNISISLPQVSTTQSKNLSLQCNNNNKITPILTAQDNESDPLSTQHSLKEMTEIESDSDNKSHPELQKELFDATVNAMKDVFHHLKKFNKNLIPSTIIRLVTISISILNHFTKMCLINLANVFYYMFDIEHMLNYKGTDKCIEEIGDLMQNLKVINEQNNRSLNQYKEDDIEFSDTANSLLTAINNYIVDYYEYRDITVNIPLMRNMMLITETKDDSLKRLIDSIPTNFLEKVALDQYQYDQLSIKNNHVQAIREMMPFVFASLIKHIKLLKVLLNINLSPIEKKKITEQNKLWKKITFTFIRRYNNFGESTSEEIKHLETIENLMNQLNTTLIGQENTEEPSEIKPDKTRELVLLRMESEIAIVYSIIFGVENMENWKNNIEYEFNQLQIKDVEDVKDVKDVNDLTTLLDNNAEIATQLSHHFADSFDKEIKEMLIHNKNASFDDILSF